MIAFNIYLITIASDKIAVNLFTFNINIKTYCN